MIEIDGSYLEGGGQILRTATALSAVKKIPCRVFNIRKKREKPGLQTQHLLALKALSEISNGKLEGDYLGSEEIKFHPAEIQKEKIYIKIPTAGAITLILQNLIPVCLFSQKPIEINFEGGATDTFFAPSIDYFRFVFLKFLEKMGAKIEIEVLKRGFYPAGGANLMVKIFPSKLKTINLTERGKIKKISIFSVASKSLETKKVAERQARAVWDIFQKLNLVMEKKIDYCQTDSPGSVIFLCAQFEKTILGVDNLGKIGKRAEEIGMETALDLLKEEKCHSCLDKYMTDQILPYLALAEGKSEILVGEITSHCRTNIWIIEKFIENGKFIIENNLIKWLPSK